MHASIWQSPGSKPNSGDMIYMIIQINVTEKGATPMMRLVASRRLRNARV